MRILQSTLAIATSTNFPNIKQVIQLKNAITKDLNDIIQYLSYTSRAIIGAKAILYLLQYINNQIYYILKEGTSKEYPNYQSILPRPTNLDKDKDASSKKKKKKGCRLAKYKQKKAVIAYILRRLSSLQYIEILVDNYTSI